MFFLIIALIQFALIAFFLFKSYQKSGLSVLADGVKLMFLLWLGNIALYNLQLSNLYEPTWQINVVVMIIVTVFYIASRKIELRENDIISVIDKLKNTKDDYKVYSVIMNFIFVVGIIVFWMNVKKHGLTILDENKIGKQPLDHYAGYIVYMLVVCAQFKYIMFRTKGSLIDLGIFLVSSATLVLTLNRGPIAFILAAVYIYEIFNLVKIKKSISKNTLYLVYATLGFGFIAFLIFFGKIGDMRVEHVMAEVYKTNVNSFYQMNENVPSGVLWGYIYLTSPLENVSFSLINQSADFTYFNNLLYPFVKLIATLIGMGPQYKTWLMSREGYSPYLQDEVGLNVSSFIPEAMQDLGYFGVVVYVVIFVLIAYFSIKALKSRTISPIASTLIYFNVVNILMWSVFVNPFRIATLLLSILFVLFIEFIRRTHIFKLVFNALFSKLLRSTL